MARILIVDDDRGTRIVLGTVLENREHEIFFAESGKEALQAFRGTMIDVVITDLHMPDLHGLELIGALRDSRPRPVIIAISATGSAQLDMAQALGADAVLSKPVDPAELRSAVTKAVAGRGSGSHQAQDRWRRWISNLAASRTDLPT